MVARIGIVGVTNARRHLYRPGTMLTPNHIKLSAWNHIALYGGPSVGTGTLEEQPDGALVMTGRFDDSPAGRRAFAEVERRHQRCQWSLGARIFRSHLELVRGLEVSVVTDWEPVEASPVGCGACRYTATLSLGGIPV